MRSSASAAISTACAASICAAFNGCWTPSALRVSTASEAPRLCAARFKACAATIGDALCCGDDTSPISLSIALPGLHGLMLGHAQRVRGDAEGAQFDLRGERVERRAIRQRRTDARELARGERGGAPADLVPRTLFRETRDEP